MRVAVKFAAYNARRYGRPWIGIVTAWPVGATPEMDWGKYLGDEGGGEAEIEAAIGDVIRSGQKDHRGGHTSSHWYVVLGTGGLVETDAAAARLAWNQREQVLQGESNPALAALSDDELLGEVARRGLHTGTSG